MQYIDENNKPISKEDIDLTKGYLKEVVVIKKEATPIDNITKFAWEDNDYIPMKMYVLNPPPAPPTQLDMIESQVAYTAMMTNTIQAMPNKEVN